MSNPSWHEKWLRTGRLPDGTTAYEVYLAPNEVYVCRDPIVIERKNKNLPVPWPDDPPAPDGFVTPWELYVDRN